jgi:AcrR family transcriptional regulator
MIRIKPLKSTNSDDTGHNKRSKERSVPHFSDRLMARKHPRQRRSKDTLAVILEAAADVFAEKGYSGATTNKIAARAGVSIGSLYQYFPNKDAILVGLRERHLGDVHAVVERSMRALADKSIPIHQALDSLIRGLIELHSENPKLTRALSNEVVPPHLVDETHQRQEADIYAREVEKILERRPEIRSGNLALMAHILVRTTEALTRGFVHEAPPNLDKDAFVEESLHLLTGYILDK